VKLAGSAAAEAQKAAAAVYAQHKDAILAKEAEEKAKEVEAADRREARKMLKAEQKRAAFEAAAEEADRAVIGLDYAKKLEVKKGDFSRGKTDKKTRFFIMNKLSRSAFVKNFYTYCPRAVEH
jgi:ABC-type lipoprotein release transport system permease subunit